MNPAQEVLDALRALHEVLTVRFGFDPVAGWPSSREALAADDAVTLADLEEDLARMIVRYSALGDH